MLGPIIYSLAKRKSAELPDGPRKRGSVSGVVNFNGIRFSQAQNPAVGRHFRSRGDFMSLSLKLKCVFNLLEYGLVEIVFEPTAPGLKVAEGLSFSI